MKRLTGVVSRGVAARILGAVALAFWFLIVDASRGTPLRTPAFLAGSVLGLEVADVGFGPILLFTALHIAAFVALGIFLSWVLSKVQISSNVLLGLVVGFALFDIMFYTSVTVTGVDVVRELGWPEVLAGNLVAGVVMMGFMHMTGATTPVLWWQVAAHNRIVQEGTVAGLLGALVVAVWFLLFDVVRGEPFFTPGALGSAMFLGASSTGQVAISAWTVAGYTVIHVGAFVVTGFIAAAIATQAEETPPLILGAILLFVAFEAFFLGLLAMVAEFLLGPLAWWTIAVGNVLATIVMGFYLWRKHPKLRDALGEDPLDRTS
jgi:hypothetical protein